MYQAVIEPIRIIIRIQTIPVFARGRKVCLWSVAEGIIRLKHDSSLAYLRRDQCAGDCICGHKPGLGLSRTGGACSRLGLVTGCHNQADYAKLVLGLQQLQRYIVNGINILLHGPLKSAAAAMKKLVGPLKAEMEEEEKEANRSIRLCSGLLSHGDWSAGVFSGR